MTQPDKPKGRGKALMPTPVKEEALKHGIPVYQPLKVREESFIRQLRELDPDVIIVAAFGQIIPKEILDMPAFGCLNIHASLLPKYRGAAPIQYAVIDGEKESGVTLMRMGTGLDTGDMQRRWFLLPRTRREEAFLTSWRRRARSFWWKLFRLFLTERRFTRNSRRKAPRPMRR